MTDTARAMAEQVIYELGHRDIDWKCCIGDDTAIEIIAAALTDAEQQGYERGLEQGKAIITAIVEEVVIDRQQAQGEPR